MTQIRPVPISRVKNCNYVPKIVLLKSIFLSSPSVSLPVVSQSLHQPLGHGQLLISSSSHQRACGGPHPRLQLQGGFFNWPPPPRARLNRALVHSLAVHEEEGAS